MRRVSNVLPGAKDARAAHVLLRIRLLAGSLVFLAGQSLPPVLLLLLFRLVRLLLLLLLFRPFRHVLLLLLLPFRLIRLPLLLLLFRLFRHVLQLLLFRLIRLVLRIWHKLFILRFRLYFLTGI